MFRSISILVLSLALITALPVSAHADLRFCNKTNETVWVTYARTDSDPNYTSRDADVHGWWQIEPGNCATALAGQLEFNRADGTYVDYYYYAHSRDNHFTWTGNLQLCTDPNIFDFTNNSQSYVCSEDNKRMFKWIETKGATDFETDLTE